MPERQVTEREFFSAIGKLNIHPRPVGDYPYTSEFRDPDGKVHGRIVNEHVDGKYPAVQTFFLS